MKVILVEKVKSLGSTGEVVNVSAGYARNFLFPRKLAVVADVKNTKILEHKQRTLTKKIEAEKKVAMELKKKIDGLVLELIKKVGTNGKLFGTVTSTEIAKELDKQGIHIERRLLSIEEQIKGVGTFSIKAKVFAGVDAEFKVKVVQDQKQAEEMKLALMEAKKAKELAAKNAKEAKAAEGETVGDMFEKAAAEKEAAEVEAKAPKAKAAPKAEKAPATEKAEKKTTKTKKA